ncbi:MAG: fibrillarin-like rRNA/tRNA 2'-O-methyltransferase [Candidatus Hadarchaeia archaeon]
MRVKKHEKFEGVHWVEFEDGNKKLATKNLSPGTRVYEEKLIEYRGEEYRTWDPYRSKLAAAILREIEDVPLEKGSKVLYLGAASGTTASHVSDIVGEEGMVYCVEISSRPLRDLLMTCKDRENIAPILDDAQKIGNYRGLVEEVDVVYQDVAHPEQTNILLENSRAFLREEGKAMIALKARSIDVTKEPREIFRNEIERLNREMEVLDSKLLDPYEKDHAMLLLKKDQ